VTAPLSYDRVLAALRRLFAVPVTITRPAGAAPAAGDSSIGKELGSIAWMAARAMDRGDAMYNELFPDTATETIDRWERNTLRPTNPALSLDERRARVLSVLRRSSGVQPSRLAVALYAVLGLDSPDDVVFFETLRAQLEPAMTLESFVPLDFAIPSSAPALVTHLGAPWPGVVDDTGVRVYIEVSGPGDSTATLTSPTGTVWNIGAIGASGYYENRTAFLDEPAGGTWKLGLLNSVGGKTLTRWELRVSNDVDSAQIYNFFVYCDPALSPTPDVQEAQRLLNRTALAHMSPSVIVNEACVCDVSACDMEPVE
jgi:hypothetical protein